jgi:hypothetical protein
VPARRPSWPRHGVHIRLAGKCGEGGGGPKAGRSGDGIVAFVARISFFTYQCPETPRHCLARSCSAAEFTGQCCLLGLARFLFFLFILFYFILSKAGESPLHNRNGCRSVINLFVASNLTLFETRFGGQRWPKKITLLCFIWKRLL